MPEVNIILGPPGTGKTENLLRIVDRELKKALLLTELLLSALLIRQPMRQEKELRINLILPTMIFLTSVRFMLLAKDSLA